jgi:hypothetical protein
MEGDMDDQRRDIEKAPVPEKLGPLTTPLSLLGVPTWAIYLFAAIGLIYILNPTSGLIEVLPDNLPIVGNLDEGVAFLMLWYGLVEFFEGRRHRE